VLAKIEADRFDELPAAFYLKQFLKTYAEMLRIDARHVVDGFFNEMAMITAESQSSDASSER
jgi:cytoskeletal protein RodZ